MTASIWIANMGEQGHNIYVGVVCRNYPELGILGKLLFDYYQDEQDIRNVCSLGSLYVLGRSLIAPSTIAYSRDLGQPHTFLLSEVGSDLLGRYKKEYNYMWRDGRWLVQHGDNPEWLPLLHVLIHKDII